VLIDIPTVDAAVDAAVDAVARMSEYHILSLTPPSPPAPKGTEIMTFVRTTLLATLALAALALPAVAEENPFADILAEMTEQLELSEEQQAAVGQHLMQFGTELDAATAEADKEEPDSQKMIGDVKKARDTFNGNMKDTLDKEQFAKFEAGVDATVQGMFNDLAAIQLMELQPALDLTDDQMTALEPIIGTGLRGMLGLIFENADKRLRKPQQISLGRSLKKIQSDMQKGVAGVLTEEQMATYQAMKEQQG